MASLAIAQKASKAPATPTTVGVAVASPELWDPVQEALRGLAVRVVMEQRDLRNWPSLIERLEFLRPEVVLLDITGLPLPLEEAVRGVRAALYLLSRDQHDVVIPVLEEQPLHLP